jgi:predicted YcjX-like family ATPase
MPQINWKDHLSLAMQSAGATLSSLNEPVVRLGVTGLSRSGKTVFIAALVHHLLKNHGLPLFDVMGSGRLSHAGLQPQPDDHVPRFALEDKLNTLLSERIWPQSTSQISQLRVTLHYESRSTLERYLGSGKMHLDIVDYPGEWLLDLPLLDQSYEEFSLKALTLSRQNHRKPLAEKFHALLEQLRPDQRFEETIAKRLHEAYRDYLLACRGR